MNNKHLISLAKIALLCGTGLFLNGCNQANSEPTQTVVKPVKLYEVPNVNARKFDSFLAEVDAADRSQLSFQIPGVIEKLHIVEGQRVKKGDVLASIDPIDYQLTLETRQAEYDLAKISYERDKSLVSRKLISTDSFDEAETDFKAASAVLDQAKTDLSYTKIIAPFDGVVSLRFAEENEYVAAKQPVLNILNTDQLDVDFSLPVPYVEKTGVQNLDGLAFSVTLDSQANLILPAKLKELSTKPDAETNSYTASVVVENPEHINVLSGMSAQVLVANQSKTGSIQIPQEALLTQIDGSQFIWRYNSHTQTVESVVVQLNEHGAIISGLEAGDLIVTAGAKTLTEGQQVRAWEREGGI